MAEVRQQRIEIAALGASPRDPVDARIGLQGWRDGVGIGRLAVVDPQHAGLFGDALHAVRQARIAGEAPRDGRGIEAERQRRGDRGRSVLGVVRTLQRGPVGLAGDLATIDAGNAADDRHPFVEWALRRDRHQPRHRGIGDIERIIVVEADYRRVARNLHFEDARLGPGVLRHGAVALEMVGGDVGQHRDIADEAEGQLELVRRQFEHIDAPCGQRLLRQDRQADVAAHPRRDAAAGEQVMDERGDRRLAVGAGDADDLVRGQAGPREGEQLDIADDRNAGLLRPLHDCRGMRHARRGDERLQPGEAGAVEVGERPAVARARRLAVVPRQHRRARRFERGDRRPPAAREAVNGIGLAGKGGRGDHRSFSVARPASASTIEMIQKRMTTVDSAQPSASKW